MRRQVADDYELDDDRNRLDHDAIFAFLHTEAYWHRWRSREDVDRQIHNSWRCVGLFAPDGTQVGFGRAVSDGVALGYLADVYVLAAHRGRGLGLALIRELVDTGAEWRWLLHTADAHSLYEKLGFSAVPSTLMERPARGH
jgi:GNAT superfamily N-acetyltransferase